MAKGFTLIELIIVLLIIALGSGLAAPKIFGVVNKLKIELEHDRLRELVKNTARESFFRQEFRAVEGEGDRVAVLPGKRTMNFKYIRKLGGRVTFSGNGIPEGPGLNLARDNGD